MPASLESSRPIMAPSLADRLLSREVPRNHATDRMSHTCAASYTTEAYHQLPTYIYAPLLSLSSIPILSCSCYHLPQTAPSLPSLPAANTMSSTKARTSVRYSTYSVAPSVTPTFATNDSAQAEFRDIATGLDRMENKALTMQRVALDDEKTDNLRKLALGAKLERALDRRMSSQDAVMRPRPKQPVISDKQQLVEKVA
ncbi:hypothetical protein G3M48_008792 [Beauveria asiatica]|uniref:Uncharacterized protein n=1 Tax=Beauveria asiatica TaxID=1069075 RepID=A0AAW0S395_9HYPO